MFESAIFFFSKPLSAQDVQVQSPQTLQTANPQNADSQSENSQVRTLQTENFQNTNQRTRNSPTDTVNQQSPNSQTQNSETRNLKSQNAAAQNSQPAAQKKYAPKQIGQDALVLYQNGDYKAAIAVCETEIKKNPDRADSYVVLCWSLVKNKQYAEAEERAAEGLKTNPYDLRLIEIFGEAKYYLGKNNGALEQFQKYAASATEGSARFGSAFYFMGEIYIRQARYQHADIAFSAAVKKEPLIAFWWTRLGYAREMAGNYYEALSAYDEALLLDATSIGAKNGKSRVSSRLQ